MLGEVLFLGFVGAFGCFMAHVYKRLKKLQQAEIDQLGDDESFEALFELPGDKGHTVLTDGDLAFLKEIGAKVVLGGTGLTRDEKIKLRDDHHLLIDLYCKLCLRPLQDLGRPCDPRLYQSPPVPCTWCDSEDHVDEFCPEIVENGGDKCICEENPCECRY